MHPVPGGSEFYCSLKEKQVLRGRATFPLAFTPATLLQSEVLQTFMSAISAQTAMYQPECPGKQCLAMALNA